MTKPLIYAAYDYTLSNTPPNWLGMLRESFPEVVVYNPSMSPKGQQGLDVETIMSLKCVASPDVLQFLSLPSDLAYQQTKDEMAEYLGGIDRLAHVGYMQELLAMNHYFLVRASIVVVDGDSAYASGAAIDLLLATQLGIPTALVCNLTVHPAIMAAYADVTVSSQKLGKLVATVLDLQKLDKEVVEFDCSMEESKDDSSLVECPDDAV